MAYGVIRTDKVSGEIQSADMVSVMFYNGTTSSAVATAVENGVIAKLGALEAPQIYKGSAAAATDKLMDCAVIAGVELHHDERKHALDEWINEAGRPVRGYLLRRGNEYGFTADCFVSGTVPTVGASVGIGTGGKISATVGNGNTTLGTCIAIETAGRYTYYVIRIAASEA